MKVKLSRNALYFRRHFSELAQKYGGQTVVIIGGAFYGACPRNSPERMKRLVERARKEYPNDVPLVTPVPTPKELAGVLV